MACSCKNKANGQVTAVKQVVKNPSNPVNASANNVVKRPVIKRVVYRRPI